MSQHAIRINQGRILPLPFVMVGTAMIGALYFYYLDNLTRNMFIILGILSSPLLPMIWTARQIFEIDMNQKKVWTYVWLMGWKIGKPEYFNGIDKIFMNETSSSQRMTSWGGQVHTSRNREYVGFVKFESGKKIELLRDGDKEFVITKLTSMSKKLNTMFVDQTQ